MSGAPATIRAIRTTPPPAVPALHDAEILAGQLVYTLNEINANAELSPRQALELFQALDAAWAAQHHLTALQMAEEQ